MRTGASIIVVLVCLAVGAVGFVQRPPTSQSAVEMKGMKPAVKLQTPVEGFLTPINGKLDMRATEIEFEPGGGAQDHYHVWAGNSAGARR